MKKSILHTKEIERASGKVICGEDQGSGFLISKNIFITARHVILNHIEEDALIKIEFLNLVSGKIIKAKGQLIDDGKDILDVALIKTDKDFDDCHLPLIYSQIRYNDTWQTYGFPYYNKISGCLYNGTVLKTNSIKPFDIELVSSEINKDNNYSGLSGSSLTIDGKVSGIITWSTVTGLGAISVLKMASFLDKNNIYYQKEKEIEDLPEELEKDVYESTPNYNILERLRSTLIQGGKYYLLYGSPGSGKTIISASFKFDLNTNDIVGRYFIRTPNDPRPSVQRTSKENFIEWLEDLISIKLTGQASPKQNISFNDRVRNFSKLLHELNSYYSKKNQLGFIIIDGLDDVANEGPDTLSFFLGILPENLPSNISVLLSVVREDILPISIKSSLSESEKVHVSPLQLEQCKGFIKQNLKKQNIELHINDIHHIAQKSEGHPLYLRYLLEIIKTTTPESIDIWLSSLPIISGDIAKYYDKIWNSDFEKDADIMWIAITVSQLREPVDKASILKMLPEITQYSFTIKYQSIQHLFKDESLISTYHSSFNLYIETKTAENIPLVHNNITKYCEENPSTEYSIANVIHHKLKGSNSVTAISKCTQEWADNCALISVEPDLVLKDIQAVETLCIDSGSITELIRIKLLLQRIRFRYDNVLAENAFSIANTLLGVGRSKEALRYILRGSLLLISDENAIFFLQRFYEVGANKEADSLLSAIRKRYQFLYEKDSETSSINSNTIILHFSAVALSINKNKDAGIEITNGISLLKKLEKDKSNRKSVKTLREYIVAWSTAYVIWRFNRYPNIQEARKLTTYKKSPDWTRLYAMMSVFIYQFKDSANSIENKSEHENLVGDIEKLIEEDGYLDDDIRILIGAILKESRRPDIVESLIVKFLKTDFSFSFREENGVDPNVDSITKLITIHLYQGYIDKKNDYPTLIQLNNNNWEQFLISALKLIGFCLGKGLRIKADNKLDSVSEVQNKINNLLLQLDITLLNRSKWDRSYSLPEFIIPIIYRHIVEFYVDFNPTEINGFIDKLKIRANNQFGIYTEGYRQSLYEMADLISKYKTQESAAFNLIQILEGHVEVATQNRWERIPALLQISELYSRINNIQKANVVYKRMLAASMGPTWYKEDQFSLINTTLALPLVKDCSINYFKEFAEYLECASGEMTFQRYVRNEKGCFINSMVKAKHIDKALGYFKHQVLPEPLVIIENAESSTVDAPRKGDGYILGAKGIIEADGIINLLSDLNADPLIIWAIIEIFIVNDDTSRYIRSFAKLQGQCFDKLNLFKSPLKNELHKRLISLIISEPFQENQHQYLKELKEFLPEEDCKILQDNLKGENISFDLSEQISIKEPTEEESTALDDASERFSFPGMGTNFRKHIRLLGLVIKKAKSQLSIENKSKSRDLLIAELKQLHQGGTDIWAGGLLSSELGEAFDLIKISGESVDLIQSLKEFILNHYTDDWRVVYNIINLLQDNFNLEDTNSIIVNVKEHFGLIIQNNSQETKFNWMNSPTDNKYEDNQVVEFLIWLLNHPHLSVKKRVINPLIWIAKVKPDIVIPLLIETTLLSGAKISSELSALVINKIAKEAPQIIWNILDEKKDLQKNICGLPHFMIKYYFREAAGAMKDLSVDSKSFYNIIDSSIPNGVDLQGEVILDDNFLRPVTGLIDFFNKIEILNGAFCKKVIEKVTEYSEPLQVFDQLRVERYINRSFHEEEIQFGSYDYLLRYCINEAIITRVSKENYEDVAKTLKIPFADEL